MRLLALETSSRLGSLVLLEHGAPVAERSYEAPNGHGERMPALLRACMAEAGWAPTSLDGVAVGRGPGSFTGLRVGLALAQGVALGAQIPAFGVGSLLAMSAAVMPTTVVADPPGDAVAEAQPAVPVWHCPIVDARREEVFIAVYAPDGREQVAPRALGRADALALLTSLQPARCLLLGEAVARFRLGSSVVGQPHTELPHALGVGRVAWSMLEAQRRSGAGPLPPGDHDALEPHYLRPVDAIRPKLPPSPLGDSAPLRDS